MPKSRETSRDRESDQTSEIGSPSEGSREEGSWSALRHSTIRELGSPARQRIEEMVTVALGKSSSSKAAEIGEELSDWNSNQIEGLNARIKDAERTIEDNKLQVEEFAKEAENSKKEIEINYDRAIKAIEGRFIEYLRDIKPKKMYKDNRPITHEADTIRQMVEQVQK